MPFLDATVSRRHFEVEHDDGVFRFRDLGAARGAGRRGAFGTRRF